MANSNLYGNPMADIPESWKQPLECIQSFDGQLPNPDGLTTTANSNPHHNQMADIPVSWSQPVQYIHSSPEPDNPNTREANLCAKLKDEIDNHRAATDWPHDYFKTFHPAETMALLEGCKHIRDRIEERILPEYSNLTNTFVAFSHAISRIADHEMERSWYLQDVLEHLRGLCGEAQKFLAGAKASDLKSWYTDRGMSGWDKVDKMAGYIRKGCQIVRDLMEYAKGMHPVHLLPRALVVKQEMQDEETQVKPGFIPVIRYVADSQETVDEVPDSQEQPAIKEEELQIKQEDLEEDVMDSQDTELYLRDNRARSNSNTTPRLTQTFPIG